MSYYVLVLVLPYMQGMPGSFSPDADFKGNRWLTVTTCITARASRTCRDACRDRLPAVVGKTIPALSAHAQPAIIRIWQEAHCDTPRIISLHCMLLSEQAFAMQYNKLSCAKSTLGYQLRSVVKVFMHFVWMTRSGFGWWLNRLNIYQNKHGIMILIYHKYGKCKRVFLTLQIYTMTGLRHHGRRQAISSYHVYLPVTKFHVNQTPQHIYGVHYSHRLLLWYWLLLRAAPKVAAGDEHFVKMTLVSAFLYIYMISKMYMIYVLYRQNMKPRSS